MLVGNLPLTRHPFFGDLERRTRTVERQLAFLSRRFTPRTVFLHLGAGDCSLVLRAAQYVERVYAIGVHDLLVKGLAWPSNVRVAACAAVPDESVDIAFTDRRVTPGQLAGVRRCLAPGGVFFCMAKQPPPFFGKMRGYALIGSRLLRCPLMARFLFEPFVLAAAK
jgi:hypothetical protein